MFKLTIEFKTREELIEYLMGSTAPAGAIAMSANVAAAEPGEEAEPATAAVVDPNDRDRNGLPWDARIHSGAGTKTATGDWRKRKGVADSVITAVEAELRARIATAAPAATPVPTPAAPATPAVAALPVPPASPVPVAATIPSAPVAAPVAAPAPVATPVVAAPAAPTRVPQPEGGVDFSMLMTEISAAMMADPVKLSEAKLAELCSLFGVTTITEIAANPLQLAQAYNWLLQEKLMVGL